MAWFLSSMKALPKWYLNRSSLIIYYIPSPLSLFCCYSPKHQSTYHHLTFHIFTSFSLSLPLECKEYKGKNFLLFLLPRTVPSTSKMLYKYLLKTNMWILCRFRLLSSGTWATSPCYKFKTWAFCTCSQYLSCPLKSSVKILFHSAQFEHWLLSKAFLNLSSIFPMHLIYSFFIINPLSYNYNIYLPKWVWISIEQRLLFTSESLYPNHTPKRLSSGY